MGSPRRIVPSISPADQAVIGSEGELKKRIAGKSQADTTQIADVVAKLSVVMADYLEGGKHIDIVLNPVEIISAVEAAIREADCQPSPWPDGADARTFFIHGLYDELIQQPSNIFETKVFPDGTERYLPIAKVTWKACLEQLREQIIGSGKKLVHRKKA